MPDERLALTLYISGRTPRAERALENLRRICDAEFGDGYVLHIVDVLEDPQRAERDRILATPTVVKELPPPLRRVIGDLSDHEKVLVGLDIRRIPA
jgi:circadian clock protein KaiB